MEFATQTLAGTGGGTTTSGTRTRLMTTACWGDVGPYSSDPGCAKDASVTVTRSGSGIRKKVVRHDDGR